jgi:rod shape-determining protein MreB
LHQATGLPVIVAKDPLNCVVLGAGKCLEEMHTMQDVLAEA